MNTKRTGDRSRQHARKWLQDRGAYCYSVPALRKASQKDAFSVADIIVILNGTVWLAQIKTNAEYVAPKYKSFTKKWKVPLLFMDWQTRKGFIFKVVENGNVTRMSESQFEQYLGINL